MKEKLNKIRDALEFYSSTAHITCANQTLQLMEGEIAIKYPNTPCQHKSIYDQVPFGTLAEKTIGILDSILADLESPELVDRAAKASYSYYPIEVGGEFIDGFRQTPNVVISWEDLIEYDEGFYNSCIEQTQAAINTIKGE